MKAEDVQKAGAVLIHVTGQDKKGDVYFKATGNKVGVVRHVGKGKYVVLCGFRGRKESYWHREGCDYTKRSYPVYEVAVPFIKPHKCMTEAIRLAVTGFK